MPVISVPPLPLIHCLLLQRNPMYAKLNLRQILFLCCFPCLAAAFFGQARTAGPAWLGPAQPCCCVSASRGHLCSTCNNYEAEASMLAGPRGLSIKSRKEISKEISKSAAGEEAGTSKEIAVQKAHKCW